jgi:hypothetical protein
LGALVDAGAQIDVYTLWISGGPNRMIAFLAATLIVFGASSLFAILDFWDDGDMMPESARIFVLVIFNMLLWSFLFAGT